MESLKVLYNTSDVEIVGISIDRRQTDWITSVNKLELPWINIRDTNGEIVKSYNVTSVPTKFVIDKEGKIVARNPDDLKLILARL